MYAMRMIQIVLYKLMRKMTPDHARITPMASTVPGIEYGSTETISKMPLPFGLILLTTYAIITPRNILNTPAETERNSELRIESVTILLPNNMFA